MRILAFTDLHESGKSLERLREKAKDADIIISAGDLSIFSASLAKVMKELDSFGKPVFMTHGNHESEEELRSMVPNFKNIVYLHQESLQAEGYIFLFYGGGGFSSKDRMFEIFIKNFKEKTKGKKLILVTHAPPYGTNLDRIGQSFAGNKSIREFIEMHSPILSISGHLHENSGKDDKIGKTVLVNPGPSGKIIRV